MSTPWRMEILVHWLAGQLSSGHTPYEILQALVSSGSQKNEISMYFGSLKLLVIGGVVITGNNEGSCFLGSSVKPLIPVMSHGKETVSRDIYVKKAQVEVATSERLLRQYYKVHADMGFYPLNPLCVEEHPVFSANADPALLCQSKIFQAYALRSVDALNLPDALQKFKASRPLKNQVAKLESAASFVELKEDLEGDDKWSKVVETLAKLETVTSDKYDLFYNRILDSLIIATNMNTLKIECNIPNKLISQIVKALNKRGSIKIFISETLQTSGRLN